MAKVNVKVKVKVRNGKAKVAVKASSNSGAATATRKVAKQFLYEKYFLHEQQVSLTAKMAARLRSYNRLDSERSKNHKHVNEMIESGADGTFNWREITVIVAIIGGVSTIINASHFLDMMSALEITPDFVPIIRVQTYCVPDVDTAKELWCNCDRGKIRTKKHRVLGILGGTEGYEKGVVPAAIVNQLQVGLNLYLNKGVPANDVPYDQLAAVLLKGGKYYEIAMSIKRILMRYRTRSIWKTGLIGAMFAIYEKDPAHAEEFFEAVCQGDASGDLIAETLYNYLMKVVVPNNKTLPDSMTGLRTYNFCTEAVFRMVVEVWNCWCVGIPPQDIEVMVKLAGKGLMRADVRIKIGGHGRTKVLSKI